MKAFIKYFVILCFNVAFSSSMSTFKKASVDIDSWTASNPITLSSRTLHRCAIACMSDPSCQAFNFDQDVCTTTTETAFFVYMKTKALLDVWLNPTSTTISEKISSTLDYNEYLKNGDYLLSPNGCFKVQLQSDGNVVITKLSTDRSVWATNTNNGPGAYRLNLRPNSELVLYQDNTIAWRTYRTGGTKCHAIAQDDSNFVVECGIIPILKWAAHSSSRNC